MREVTLADVLDARDARAAAQRELLERHRGCVVSFSMNIAGPVKDSPLIRRTFDEGCRLLKEALAGFRIFDQREKQAFTGCELLLAVDGDARAVKRLCVEIEDAQPVGRLFDMDVLDSGGKVDRRSVGGSERACLVCGRPGRDCASRRLHPLEDIRRATERRMAEHFAEQDCRSIAAAATSSLRMEVTTTPKPGLVDCENSGSHRDMNLDTFLKSIAALEPYWPQCARIGRETAQEPPAATFHRLRKAGREAESAMLAATSGVNTHKGAIFTLGILCGAMGRLAWPEGPCRGAERILDECAAMTTAEMERELDRIRGAQEADTAGKRLIASVGLTGIRGEVAAGLPSVRNVGLPAMKAALEAGCSRNDANVIALLHLIAHVVDTNMIARGGVERARSASEAVARLLEEEPLPRMEDVRRLDRAFIAENLSPGGCADLLAATCLLWDWGQHHKFS